MREDPKAPKSVVNRQVVRLVTQGTLTEDSLLDARAHNHLAAMADAGGCIGLAWLDISTGEFTMQPVEAGDLVPFPPCAREGARVSAELAPSLSRHRPTPPTGSTEQRLRRARV